MKNIFFDATLEKKFLDNGYVVVDFLNEKQLKELQDIHTMFPSSPNENLSLSVKSLSIEKREFVYKKTVDVVKNEIDKILIEHKVIISGFITKFPSENIYTGLHRDPSFTDENKHTTILLWAPLINTTSKNGTFHVIPKSNRVFKGYKTLTTGKYDFSTEENEIIKEHGIPVNLKKGQAVIVDTATLHYSTPNRSKTPRVVLSLILIPKSSPIILYHINKEKSQLEIYEANENYVMSYYDGVMKSGSLPLKLLYTRKSINSIVVNKKMFQKKLIMSNIMCFLKKLLRLP